MTSTVDPPVLSAPTSGLQPVRWHRPLVYIAVLMSVMAAFALVARFISPIEIGGLNQWDKPLKFALSIVVYSIAWSWLIGQLQRFRRTAWVAGAVIVVTLLIEMVIIVGAAAFGTTSHFNVSTPLAVAALSLMGAAVSVLWIASLLVSVLLFFSHLGDAARTVAIRSGAILSVVGLALGYLMTGPTSAQLADPQGVVGAHTVGLPDGGPGLAVLGWSTEGGDLRIPHFVGMHALQVIPIALIVLELLSRRIVILRDVTTRAGLTWIVAATYAGAMGLLTWQALRGESIVDPGGQTVAGALILACAALAASGLVLRAHRIRVERAVR